ncbi:MAG: PHP domain-containing protein [bacterium]|nr:PHP domain-containing protein [bacterium]
MDNNSLQRNTYQYYGAIHIHTKYSDGTGDIYEISKAAKKAGLDWIIITDHNNFECEEGIFNDIYVIRGEEISPHGGDHYLALGINNQIEPNKDVQININKVREQGGFGFAAHPDESQCRKNKHIPLLWKNKEIIPDGLEIWNWFSNWGDNLNDRNIFQLAYSFLFKNKIITSPRNELLSWWDELNLHSQNIVPAIGGVDAHALKFRYFIIPVTVFPYKTCFKTITNVISTESPLSSDFETAKKQILTSIKQGKNTIVNRNICNEVPQINISNGKNSATCGEAISLTDNTYLNILTNKQIGYKIINDGKEYSQAKTNGCEIPIKNTGKYRIEFSYAGRNFAYTNPIFVTQGES